LLAAAMIHLGAIAFANAHKAEGPTAAGSPSESAEISIEPANPDLDPQPTFDPLPTSPAIDDSFVQDPATPPPVRQRLSKSTPVVRSPAIAAVPRSLNLSGAKALAVSTPRPEYPFEARRQKITGSGLAVLSVDAASGNVKDVRMSQSTGSPFLDNAAIAGFRRWRFKPGSVSTVTCPVTFTLSGASY
jgi:periplasmic protein TonB